MSRWHYFEAHAGSANSALPRSWSRKIFTSSYYFSLALKFCLL